MDWIVNRERLKTDEMVDKMLEEWKRSMLTIWVLGSSESYFKDPQEP